METLSAGEVTVPLAGLLFPAMELENQCHSFTSILPWAYRDVDFAERPANAPTPTAGLPAFNFRSPIAALMN